ncbi:MAG TPA: CRTAC1 family protein [Abditibacteriaceae bacterium]|jgi:hypothetical protein
MNNSNRIVRRVGFLLALLASSFLAGCAQTATEPQKPVAALPVAPSPVPVNFTNITDSARIRFKHNNGAFGGKLMPETFGSGVAFLDYNGDNFQDIFFVNSRDWTESEIKAFVNRKWTEEERKAAKSRADSKTPINATRKVNRTRKRQRTLSALYRNNGDGTFSDVTQGSGLEVQFYGMGVTVGDYDNDSRTDLYVTALERNYLFRNTGNGKFQEVAGQARVLDSGWSTSAAWLDYDKDGFLDLFVCHYVRWTPATDVFQNVGNNDKVYSSPGYYAGQGSRLFRNLGNGRFADVSIKAGIQPKLGDAQAAKKLKGKGLGVALCDFNNDNWLDVLVANDMVPNQLFKNNRNGTFSEIAEQSGIAYSPQGKARAGMGIDAADIDHSDRESVVIGNFPGQMLGLYHNQPDGQFIDVALLSVVGRASINFSTFGCAFIDIDNDGWPDILTANGHVDDSIGSREPHIGFAQRLLLLRNEGRNNFQEIGRQSGAVFEKRIVGRGVAYADIDLDGDLDAAVSVNAATPLVLQNNGGNANNWIRLVLCGTKSNRDAIGAIVKVKLGSSGLRRMVRSGSSYLSQNELPLTLGLGDMTVAEEIGIRWPSGKVTRLKNEAARQILVVDEDAGVVQRQRIPAR